MINFEILAVAYNEVNQQMEVAIRLKFNELKVNSEISLFLTLSFALFFYVFLLYIYSYV